MYIVPTECEVVFATFNFFPLVSSITEATGEYVHSFNDLRVQQRKFCIIIIIWKHGKLSKYRVSKISALLYY